MGRMYIFLFKYLKKIIFKCSKIYKVIFRNLKIKFIIFFNLKYNKVKWKLEPTILKTSTHEYRPEKKYYKLFLKTCWFYIFTNRHM